MNDLISIIVPVYNVEDYLDKCINSIINQTYTNIEIIIINDGSTDNSYEICKSYKDKRIKLYSIKNKGLSGARNYGISKSKGKYLAFVDSDDYIEKDYIEVLYNNLIKEDADLSCCSLYEVFKNEIKNKSKKDKYYVMNSYETIEKTFTDEGLNVYVWNKLYKKELFKNIKFPVNKNSEDIYVMHEIISSCKKIVYESIPKYYYVQRKNSIVNNINKINIDSIEASLHAVNYLKNNKELQRYAIKNYLNTRLRYYKKLLYSNKEDKTIRNDYLRELKKYKKIPYTKKEKLELFLFKYIPGIYKLINKKYYDNKYNKMF